ncbi:MAG TPA: O-antigen polysaccharide polymerase Wzy [Chitinophagaceae bacterium]|nr:O-antigen polysaccharide polymerase Wzy [Chitinophagaceae bacterium]
MQLPEDQYFAYAIPAILCFIVGLHINAGNLKGEILNVEAIKLFTKNKMKLPYTLIVIGFFGSVASSFVSSELSFVFYLFGSAKFIGVFLLILGSKNIKPLPLVIVYGSIIVSSLGEGMFHDLITWIIFLGSVYAIKYKPSIAFKSLFVILFILMVVSIQLIKGTFRDEINGNIQESGMDALNKAYQENTKRQSFFNFNSLATSNVRINQGFIITNIMNMVPRKVPYSDGAEMMQIINAAILPRFLSPNKLSAGDLTIFIKYTGLIVREGTSMGISSLGDAYLNFGAMGGSIFMFLLGLLYSQVLNVFYKNSKTFPILLLFCPLVFYYPIRPDCELQTILGHLVKSCILIYVMLVVWRSYFKNADRVYHNRMVSSGV